MTCDDRRDLMPLFVADALDVDEREALRGHLAGGCAACAGWLAEARATFGAVGLAADPVRPSAALVGRIMDRIDADARRRLRPGGGTSRWLSPLAAAAAAAVVTFGVLSALRPRREANLVWQADARANLLQATLDERARTVAELQRELAEQDQIVSALQKPTTAVVTLGGVGQAKGDARLVWDGAGGRSVLLAAHLAPPPTGRQYELWFFPAGASAQPVRAAVFDVGPDGSATVPAAIPTGLGALGQAAVTDEPTGGTAAPTGTIRLAGKP